MTQNPFDALGGGMGGLDMGALLAQAQQMQEQLAATQERLTETVVEGSAGGVVVKLTGGGDLVAVTFTPGSITPDSLGDPEALTDLGDLVVAAYRDAKSQADKLASDAFAGGLPDGLDLGALGFGAPGGSAESGPEAGKLGF